MFEMRYAPKQLTSCMKLDKETPLLDEEDQTEMEGGALEGQFIEEEKVLDYSDFVWPGQNKFAQLLGWLDYHDQLYSRRFQRIEHTAVSVVFGIGGFMMNKFYMLIWMPI